MPYALLIDEPVGEAFPRLARDQLDEAVTALSTLDRKTAVHEARKSCKRVRSLLRMYRPGLGSLYKAADREVRDIARLLSGTRDQDVLPATCEGLLNETMKEETRGAVESTRDLLLSTTNNQDSASFDGVIARLEAIRVASQDWRAKRPRRSAADGVKRVYRDGRRIRQKCDLDGPATPWHELRKSVKHHAYHAKLMKKLHPAGRAYAKPWGRLGELLGREHDLSVLMVRLAEITHPEGRSLELVLLATGEKRARLRLKAIKLATRLYDPSPRLVRKVVRELLPK